MSTWFFDCNVMMGSRSTPRPESDLSDTQILEELERTGIGRALFVHAWAKELDPRTGNDQAAELAAQHARLVPAFAALPGHTGEFPAGDELVKYLRDGGARAVWLYPQLHGFGLGEPWCGSLFGVLEEAQIPVLITLDQTRWEEIDQVLTHHPRLTLIVCRTSYRIARQAWPLLARHSGLRIETSWFELHLGVEEVVQRFGAERLVFGSGLPEYDAGGALSAVLYAAVSAEQRQQIAGGTLASLLGMEPDTQTADGAAETGTESAARPVDGLTHAQGPGAGSDGAGDGHGLRTAEPLSARSGHEGARPAPRTSRSGQGELWPVVRAGEKLSGELIIDCHGHLGPWNQFYIPRPDVEGMLFALDTCGIDKVACAPHAGIGPAEQLGDEQITAAVRAHPDRFIGYCTVNPWRGEEAIRRQLERHVLHGELSAIKIHPSLHHCAVTDDRYRPMWEFAQEHGVPVLSHTWESSPECGPALFEELTARYPDVDMLLGHSGGTCAGMDQAIETARGRERIYLDLTGSLLPRGMLEHMVDQIGEQRILFGTDIPFVDARSQIGYVACARISDQAKRAIFGLNAQRIFHVR